MLPTGLSPMLATAGSLPIGDGWAYEVKWDGVRALVAVEGGRARAISRAGNDLTAAYPELASLQTADALLDGELVSLVNGIPDFGALQSRMHVRLPSAALVAATPVSFLAFDLLHLGGRSLLELPYDERRTLLSTLELAAPEPFHGDGQLLFETTRAQGLEGVVAKRRDSPYLPGRRSAAWVKTKHVRRQSVLVCGWKAGQGGRSGLLGSLLLGVHSPQGLGYAGHVGTGFTAATLRQLGDLLAPLARADPPYDEEVPRLHARGAHWVHPVLVVDVEFTGWTSGGRLRHPSYKGMRGDLDQTQVVREP